MSARPLPEPALADDLGGPALRAFFRMAEQWNLRIADQRKLQSRPLRGQCAHRIDQFAQALFRDKTAHINHQFRIGGDTECGAGIGARMRVKDRRVAAVGNRADACGVSAVIAHGDPAQADAWLHKPNQSPLFGGHSALERMLSGNVSDLYVVRQYLDAQRG